MSLLDEMKKESNPRHQGCVVASIVKTLKGQDLDDLLAAIGDSTITHVAIAKVLRNRGHDVDKAGKQVARHRRRECQCED